MKATNLTLDDGADRENGAPRTLACLLPSGQGAIFTFLGAPADRVSEYQSFTGATPPVQLSTPYVRSCLAASAGQ